MMVSETMTYADVCWRMLTYADETILRQRAAFIKSSKEEKDKIEIAQEELMPKQRISGKMFLISKAY